MTQKADAETWKKRLKIFGAILCILMVRVWETVQSQRLERRVKTYHQEADRLTYENGRLQVQIHQYEAPSHLETMAKTTYSMIPVDSLHRVGLQP
jgi:hypothetical protein